MEIHYTVGLIGVVLFYFNYFLKDLGKISKYSVFYIVTNFASAGCILYSLFWDFNLPSFVLFSVWILLNLIYLYKGKDKEK